MSSPSPETHELTVYDTGCQDIEATSLLLDRLQEPARRVILFMDCCFSAASLLRFCRGRNLWIYKRSWSETSRDSRAFRQQSFPRGRRVQGGRLAGPMSDDLDGTPVIGPDEDYWPLCEHGALGPLVGDELRFGTRDQRRGRRRSRPADWQSAAIAGRTKEGTVGTRSFEDF
ncbi:hypothetical protein RHECNPAF_1740029 [Rhizobium etli CNPAF512]|nr:hypothetical protein RHECNPAF_1740029 [Rhizobium etli CNPAF512]